MARHQYKKPPVVEAICQIQLLPTAGFSIAELALLHKSVSVIYPGQSSERVEVQTDIVGGLSADGSSEVQSKYKVIRKALFPSDEGTRFVAVSANEVSIHTLSPYDGWEPFRARIAQVLAACGKMEALRPASRVAVRYINRVAFPGYNIPLSDYFTKAPEYPDGVPVQGMQKFLSRVECLYADPSISLTIVMADIEPKGIQFPSFILDLEVAWANRAGTLAVSAALPLIEDLKERLSVAFENCVTEEARRGFDVE